MGQKHGDRKKNHYPQNPECKCPLCQYNRNRDVAIGLGRDIDDINAKYKEDMADIKQHMENVNEIHTKHNEALDGLKDIAKEHVGTLERHTELMDDLRERFDNLGKGCDVQFKTLNKRMDFLESESQNADHRLENLEKDWKEKQKTIDWLETENKRAALRLRKLEDWKKTIITKVMDAIYDAKGKIKKRRDK